MHQRAINLVGSHAAIFEQQNGIVSFEFPGCAKGCLHQRKAAAEQYAFPCALHKRRSAKRNFPTALGIANGLEEGGLIVTTQSIRTVFKARLNHWSVKRNPTAHLPEIDLQHGQIAVADDTFCFGEFSLQFCAKKVSGTVAPAQADQAGNVRSIRGVQKTLQSFIERRRKIASWSQFMRLHVLQSQTPQFQESCELFRWNRGRRTGSEPGDGGTFSQRFRFAGCSGTLAHPARPTTGTTSVMTPWRFNWSIITRCWRWLTSASNSTVEYWPAMETRNCSMGI